MSSPGGNRVNEDVDVGSAELLRPSEGWCRDLMFFSYSCNSRVIHVARSCGLKELHRVS